MLTILAAFIKASFDIFIAMNEPKPKWKTQSETFITPSQLFHQELVVTDDTNSVHSVGNGHLGEKEKTVTSSYTPFKDLILGLSEVPYTKITGIYMGQQFLPGLLNSEIGKGFWPAVSL